MADAQGKEKRFGPTSNDATCGRSLRVELPAQMMVI
jgi:hypothetical protein